MKYVLHIYVIRATIIHLSHSVWIVKRKNTFYILKAQESNHLFFWCSSIQIAVISRREHGLYLLQHQYMGGSSPMWKCKALSFTRFWLFSRINFSTYSLIQSQNLTLTLWCIFGIYLFEKVVTLYFEYQLQTKFLLSNMLQIG